MPRPAAQPPSVDIPPPPRFCVDHADVVGRWQCETCDAFRCDDCVHIYASRDGKVASCKTCGDMCVDPDHLPFREARAGAVESDAERAARHRRDVIFPAVTVGVGAVFVFMVGFASSGVYAGLIHAIGLLALGVPVILGVIVLLANTGWVDFGENTYFPLKAAAIAAAIQGTRALFALILPLAPPGGGGMLTAAAGAFEQLFFAMLTFFIAPIFAATLSIVLFFEMDLSEKPTAITLIVLAESASLILLSFAF